MDLGICMPEVIPKTYYTIWVPGVSFDSLVIPSIDVQRLATLDDS